MEAIELEFIIVECNHINKNFGGFCLKDITFALSYNPKLLILDEATGNFDLAFRAEFQKLMTAFIQDGLHSVIFSSHVFDEMERIADYILFMDKGEVVLYMDRESIIQEYRRRYLYNR